MNAPAEPPPPAPPPARRIAWEAIVFQGVMYAYLIGAVAVSVTLAVRGAGP